IFRLLFGDGVVSELPLALAATSTNVPEALALMTRLSVAELPDGSIEAKATTMTGGTNAGLNEKVEPVRFEPVTWTPAIVVPARACLRLMDAMTGNWRIVKSVCVVAVLAPTVTEIGPVVAPAGTVTTSVEVVADTTCAGVPLNLTVLADAVAL